MATVGYPQQPGFMPMPSPPQQYSNYCLQSPPMSVPPPMSMSMPPPPLPPAPQLMPLPPMPAQSQQLTPPRRLDLGYESEDNKDGCCDSSELGHSTPASANSRPGSPCDSARPESPDAEVSQLAEDLAGFRIDGPRPVDMALSQQMEIVWHERFIDFFSRFPFGSWHLYPVFDPPDMDNTGIPRNQWRYCKDQAKVRFICTSCQKAWTSMGGQVVFWIYKDDATNNGYVHFKLYGQKCSDCGTKYYEHAIWYQEEVEKVIENLYHQVGHMYYGMPARRKRVDRRMGHPKREHNTATCQACRDHVCRMGQLQKRKGGSGGGRGGRGDRTGGPQRKN